MMLFRTIKLNLSAYARSSVESSLRLLPPQQNVKGEIELHKNYTRITQNESNLAHFIQKWRWSRDRFTQITNKMISDKGTHTSKWFD